MSFPSAVQSKRLKTTRCLTINLCRSELAVEERPVRVSLEMSPSRLAKEHAALAARIQGVPELHSDQWWQAVPQLKLVRSLPLPKKPRQMYLPKPRNRVKTMVLDLDETLVHCPKPTERLKPDVHIPMRLPTGEFLRVGVNIRPYVKECLKAARKHFEVVVFTASQQYYADPILDYLDPRRNLIHHRLYRQQCQVIHDTFVKDLRIFSKRQLKDIVIVDNSPPAFAHHLLNGVPIRSWFSDKNDRQLLRLKEYMPALAQAEDVRVLNKEHYDLEAKLKEFEQVRRFARSNTVRLPPTESI